MRARGRGAGVSVTGDLALNPVTSCDCCLFSTITLQIKSHPRISTKLPQSPTFGPDSSVTRKKRVRPSRRRSSSSPSTYQRNNRTRELSRLRKPNSRPPIFLMFFGSLPLSSFYLAILARNIAILIPVRKSTLSHPQAPTNAST